MRNETITDSRRIELDFPAECIRTYLDCVVSHGLIHIPSPSYYKYLIELHEFARFLQHDALIKWTICHIRTDDKICAAQVLLLAARFEDDIDLLKAAFHKLQSNKSIKFRGTDGYDRTHSFTSALPARYLATIAEWACLLPASRNATLPTEHAVSDIELFVSDLKRHEQDVGITERESLLARGKWDAELTDVDGTHRKKRKLYQ